MDSKEYIEKLFTPNLSYAELIVAHKLLTTAEKEKIAKTHSCFIDWLLDPNVNNLESDKKFKEFRQLLYSAVASKLEVCLTAVGYVKLSDCELELLRTKNFLSSNELRKIVKATSKFEVVTRTGEEYLKLSGSGNMDLPSKSVLANIETVQSLGKLKNPPVTEKSKILSDAPEENKTLNDASEVKEDLKVSSLFSKAEDSRAKQLRFLYQCQPDVIVALQNGVSIQQLFKAYDFWKSFCSLSHPTFIDWILDMAKFKSSQSDESEAEFQCYVSSVRMAVAREARNYVTSKARAVDELMMLVSKAQPNFIDSKFLFEALRENPDVVNVGLTIASATSSSLIYCCQNVTESEVPTTSGSTNPTVADSDQNTKWCLAGMEVPREVRAKVVSILTKNVNWSAIVGSLNRLAHEQTAFTDQLFQHYDCYIDFLIEFARKFKPTLALEVYTSRLIEIVIGVVKLEVCLSPMKALPFHSLLKAIARATNGRKIMDTNFLKQSLQAGDSNLVLEHGWVRSNRAELLASNSDSVPGPEPLEENETAVKIMSFGEMMNISHLKPLLTSELKYKLFLQAFRLLSDKAKKSLNHHSKSFYSLLFGVADKHSPNSDAFKEILREVVLNEIETLFNSTGATSMLVEDVIAKLYFRDSCLIHPCDIREALKHFSKPVRLHIEDGYLQFKHELDIVDAESTTRRFIEDMNMILSRSEVPKFCLIEIFRYVRDLPQSFAAYIMRCYGTIFHFMCEVILDKTSLFRVLEDELLNYLGNKTLFCEELLRHFFREVPDFMSSNEFIDFLLGNKNLFVVVGHHLIGNIVAAVRRAGFDGQPMFFDKFEESVFSLCKELFLPDQAGTMSVYSFLNRAWAFPSFNIEQRDFVFGVQPSSGLFVFHEMHFRRYLLMHPSKFSILGDNVRLLSESNIPILSSKMESNETAIVISEGEDISETTDLTPVDDLRPPSTRKRTNSSSAEKTSRKQAKKRKKHKHSKKHSESPRKDAVMREDTASTLVDSLPNHLLLDVAVGKLLAAKDHQMTLNELSTSLCASLFRDEDLETCEGWLLDKLFKSKVSTVLKQDKQFELLGTSKDGSFERIHLLFPEASNSQSSQRQLPLVFRWIHRLTGVSNKKLTNYISKVLDVNGKSLKLRILFTMVNQKFGARTAVPDLSDEVIHCQVISCLKLNPNLFINPVRRTCCIDKQVNENERPESLLSVTQGLPDVKLEDFIAQCLEDEECSQGLSMDELVSKVFLKFKNQCGSLTQGSIKVILQAVVGENRKFGFTPLGKIARRREEAIVKQSETPEESSDDEELKMDVSDEDTPVFPDSTNKETHAHNDEDSSLPSAEEMRKDYVEAEVIRLPLERRKSDDEHAQVDSTTDETPASPPPTDCQPSTSRPKDPRLLRGKSFSTPRCINTSFKESSVGHVSSSSREICIENTADLIQKSEPSLYKHAVKKCSDQERVNMLGDFAVDYISKCGYSCETQIFINAAYDCFKEHRFARSILAFEAYVREFIANSNEMFSFGNCYGDVGVTWTFYRPARDGETYRAKTKLPFGEILHIIPRLVYSFLVHFPEKKANLNLVCNEVASQFAEKMSLLHPSEVTPMCRNLILISCIRDLRTFMFAKSQPILYVRPPVETKTVHTPLLPRTPSDAPKSKAAVNTISALKCMVKIIRRHGPCSSSALRDYWMHESELQLRKVFGTGVSFAISLRKFAPYFPTDSDGLVHINEGAFKQFLRKND